MPIFYDPIYGYTHTNELEYRANPLTVDLACHWCSFSTYLQQADALGSNSMYNVQIRIRWYGHGQSCIGWHRRRTLDFGRRLKFGVRRVWQSMVWWTIHAMRT
jgi:hypothetical protein